MKEGSVMALDLPSPTTFASHKDEMADSTALQRAADLLSLATGVVDTPTDALEARLVTAAILDMAWYLQTRHEDAESSFSPFSSERIGSYSYNKVAEAARAGDSVGVPAFDQAVAYFNAARLDALYGSVETEWVFTQGFHEPTPPSPTIWDRPVVTVIEGGALTVDADGNPIIEIEG